MPRSTESDIRQNEHKNIEDTGEWATEAEVFCTVKMTMLESSAQTKHMVLFCSKTEKLVSRDHTCGSSRVAVKVELSTRQIGQRGVWTMDS